MDFDNRMHFVWFSIDFSGKIRFDDAFNRWQVDILTSNKYNGMEQRLETQRKQYGRKANNNEVESEPVFETVLLQRLCIKYYVFARIFTFFFACIPLVLSFKPSWGYFSPLQRKMIRHSDTEEWK